MGVLEALEAAALLIADLARRAIGVLPAAAAGARLVVGAPRGRDAKRPRRRAVAVSRALEADLVDAAGLLGDQGAAIAVGAAVEADFPRPWLKLLTDEGKAVRVDVAALPAAARPGAGGNVDAVAPAVDVGFAEVPHAVVAVVEARAVPARLVRPAAEAAAADGVAGRAALLLGLLFLLLGENRRLVQGQAEG